MLLDRYTEFRRNSVNTAVHFIHGEYKGLSNLGEVNVKMPMAGKTIRLKVKPGDIIIGCDGFSRSVSLISCNSVVREKTLVSENIPIPALAKNYGAAFSYEIRGLHLKMKEFITPDTFRDVHSLIDTLPSIHRLRVFRQQSDQLYLGVSLSSIEYEQLSTGREAPGLWQEVSQLLKNYGISISGMLKFLIDLASVLAKPILPIPRSVFTIQPSYSETPVAKMNTPIGTVIYLAGDAALSPNFVTYSGLNTGLRSAEFIAKKLFFQTIDTWETIDEYTRLQADLTRVVIAPVLMAIDSNESKRSDSTGLGSCREYLPIISVHGNRL
jgi:hypothetical protein